jgi:hypothetical protein
MSKIYGGNAKIITTKYGDMWTISQSKKELETLLKYINDNGTEYVNSSVKEKPQKVEGKATHYLEVYESKANATNEKKEYNPTPAKNEMVNKFEGDALPF